MVGYGSIFDLPKLSPEEVGKFIKDQRPPSWVAVARVFTTIVELGATLIPGVGALFQTGVALGAAGINTTIDKSQGQVSGLSLGLNFGAAAIPGLSAGISGAKQLGNLERGLEEVAALGRKQSIQGGLELSRITKAVNAGKTFPNFDEMMIANLETSMSGAKLQTSVKQINKTLERTRKWSDIFNPDKVITDIRGIYTPPKFVSDAQLLGEGKNSLLGILNDSNKRINEALDLATGRKVGALVGGEAVDDLEEDVRKAFQRAGLSITDVATLQETLSRASRSEWNSLTYDFLMNRFGRERTLQIIEEISKGKEAQKYAKWLMQDENVVSKDTKWWKRFVQAAKKPSSSEFNDVIVQPTQAIFDAGDLGRAPIEATYKKLNKYFKRIFAKLGKAGKNIAKIDEAFEKAGGILVNSDVIIGYKELEQVGNDNLVQIAFYHTTTGARHATWNGRKTKNYGGKKPVFVHATNHQLKRLRREGMNYYQKKWALSKGGRPIGIESFGWRGLTDSAQLILPFINTGLMRNMLSLASNVIDNVDASIKGTGGWTNGWVEKFQGSFKRNWKGRAGRLFGRTVLGGLAGAKFGSGVGMLVGKEAQRLMGGITASINYATAHPNQSFGAAFKKEFRRQIKTRAMQTVRSNLNRRVRKTSPGGAVRQSMSARRKLGFVQRIPGAIKPGRLNVSKITRF